MVILSYEFTLLFLVFFCVYWSFRHSIKIQNLLLILAGLLFSLSWNWMFVFSLLLMWQLTQICVIIIDMLNNAGKQLTKKFALFIGLAGLLAHLCFFKYSNFFISEVNNTGWLADDLMPLDIIMPLGVSFYTFQAISYLYDVYTNKMKPIPSSLALGILTFVPSLTAGPIFRPKDAIHQWQLVDNKLSKEDENDSNKQAKDQAHIYNQILTDINNDDTSPQTTTEKLDDHQANDSDDISDGGEKNTSENNVNSVKDGKETTDKQEGNTIESAEIVSPILKTENSDIRTTITKISSKPSSKTATEIQIQTIDPTTGTRQVLYPYLAAVLIMFALAKKVVLASWLEQIWVTPIFANPLQFNGLEVLTGIYAYSLQLFFDFSGYTDLAIALALLLGFRIPENFRQPYLATDIQDFWNRWHISLSTWIRDYVYIPLGGNRCSFWRVQFNLFLAFVLSGIWHGAGWNFFIWGAIHGIAMVYLGWMKQAGHRYKLTKFSKNLSIFLTFNYVAFGWIFFHSSTFEQATDVLKGLFHFDGRAFSLPVFMTLLGILLTWWIYPKLTNSRQVLANGLKRLPWWLLPIVLSLYVVVIFAIAPDGLPGFIYANF